MNHRVIAYIDGFNLYYGLRESNLKWAYWLNLQSLMQTFLWPNQSLLKTKYFTAIVTQPPDKHARQKIFLEALLTLSDFEIYYGHFLTSSETCHKCGHTYTAYHEKMTDVNIATQMLVDAYADHFDTAFLVTADSDLSAPLKAINKLFPQKKILVLFPPGHASKQLMNIATGIKRINRANLSKSLFPDPVIKPDGFELKKPTSWQ